MMQVAMVNIALGARGTGRFVEALAHQWHGDRGCKPSCI
jgi:hypothetical protein